MRQLFSSEKSLKNAFEMRGKLYQIIHTVCTLLLNSTKQSLLSFKNENKVVLDVIIPKFCKKDCVKQSCIIKNTSLLVSSLNIY